MKASPHMLRVIVEHFTHMLTICSCALTDLTMLEDEDEKKRLRPTIDQLEKILKTCFDALVDLIYPENENEPK